MSRIQPAYTDRVRYTLQHDQSGSLIIQEPIGFKNDDVEIIRDKKLHGVMTMMTNSLKFTNDGRVYINNVYQTYGVNADLRLIKDERNPQTDIFERVYDGFLDLTTWQEEDNKVSVKFNSSGLSKLLKNRKSDKIELERLDTLKGTVLDPLDIDLVSLQGRQIFLKSLLEIDPINSVTQFFMRFTDGNTRTGSLGVPTKVTYKSDIHIHSVAVDSMTTTPDDALVEQLFYSDNDRDKTLNLDIQLTATVNQNEYKDVDNGFIQLVLAVFENSTNFTIKQRIILDNVPINELSGYVFNVNYNNSIELLEGESLSLQWYGGGDFGNPFIFGEINLFMENIISSINIEEDSFFDATQSKFILPYEMFDRIFNVITDRSDAFYSEALGRTDLGYDVDGIDTGALCGIAHGFWVRGFDEDKFITDASGVEQNQFKPLSTSLKDAQKSFFSVWNLGLGVEKIGFQERVRIEEKEYFYNRNVLIKIGKMVDGTFVYSQVSKVKRSIATEFYESGYEFGYDRIEDYEEAMGLDEYNMKSTFTSTIDRVEKIGLNVSKYRADSYGMEFARRRQYDDEPTEDTKYDKHIFMMDLKRGATSVFEQRLWQDDFAKEPTGVFSPETATNLRMSPVNMLLRHGTFLQAGLTKYPLDYIRYGSSVSNSDLATQLIGGVEYTENGEGDTTQIIQNQNLNKARYIPEWVEFEHEVDFDLLKQINGTTVILGKEIVNWYGLIAFQNERGQIEKGFLYNLKPTGQGKWKVLKYNN